LKNNLEGIKKGETFEDYCAIVLNLLGVEELYQYPRDKQAGRADGIIKAVGLDILYDCTLREDFEKELKNTIENLPKLLENKISYVYRDTWEWTAPAVLIVEGILSEGFELPHSNLTVITEGNIFGFQKKNLES